MAAVPNRHRSATVPTGRRSRASRVIPRRSTTSPATDRRSRASRVVPRCRSTWSSRDLGLKKPGPSPYHRSTTLGPVTSPPISEPTTDVLHEVPPWRADEQTYSGGCRRWRYWDGRMMTQPKWGIQPAREAPATPLEPHDATPERRPPRMRPPMLPPERTSPTDRPAVTDSDFAPEPQPPQLHPPARRRRRTRPSPTDRPAVTDADFPRQGR